MQPVKLIPSMIPRLKAEEKSRMPTSYKATFKGPPSASTTPLLPLSDYKGVYLSCDKEIHLHFMVASLCYAAGVLLFVEATFVNSRPLIPRLMDGSLFSWWVYWGVVATVCGAAETIVAVYKWHRKHEVILLLRRQAMIQKSEGRRSSHSGHIQSVSHSTTVSALPSSKHTISHSNHQKDQYSSAPQYIDLRQFIENRLPHQNSKHNGPMAWAGLYNEVISGKRQGIGGFSSNRVAGFVNSLTPITEMSTPSSKDTVLLLDHEREVRVVLESPTSEPEVESAAKKASMATWDDI